MSVNFLLMYITGECQALVPLDVHALSVNMSVAAGTQELWTGATAATAVVTPDLL